MLSLARATAASARSLNRESHSVHRMLLGSAPLVVATLGTTPSQPGSTARSLLRDARVTSSRLGALSIDGTDAPEVVSSAITRNDETPGTSTAALAGNAGAAAMEKAAVGSGAAGGAGAARTPLSGAAIVATPSAPAIPTCGAFSERRWVVRTARCPRRVPAGSGARWAER